MKIIFGGVYRKTKHDSINDQHYYIYIPVAFKDRDGIIKYRMVDTHVIQNTCWGKPDIEKRLWYLEQANCGETSWKIYHDPSNYYYQNYYPIPSDELDDNEWELLGDLHDYVIVSDDESRNYLAQDKLVCLPLWHEDNFRWHTGAVGCNYVKKNAKKDGYKVYRNACSDYSFGFRDYYAEELKKVCQDVLANMSLPRGAKKEIRTTLKKIRKYLKLSKEYSLFEQQLQSRR